MPEFSFMSIIFVHEVRLKRPSKIYNEYFFIMDLKFEIPGNRRDYAEKRELLSLRNIGIIFTLSKVY